MTNCLFHSTLDISHQTSEVTNCMACVPNFVIPYIAPFKFIATMATLWLEKAKKKSILFQVRYCILGAHNLVVSDLRLQTKGSLPVNVLVSVKQMEKVVRTWGNFFPLLQESCNSVLCECARRLTWNGFFLPKLTLWLYF